MAGVPHNVSPMPVVLTTKNLPGGTSAAGLLRSLPHIVISVLINLILILWVFSAITFLLLYTEVRR
jgi:hypothetical protein